MSYKTELNLLENTELIKVYVKGDNFEVGKEADVAHELLTTAFIGYKTFASHLASPLDKAAFFENMQEVVFEMLQTLKEEITNP